MFRKLGGGVQMFLVCHLIVTVTLGMEADAGLRDVVERNGGLTRHPVCFGDILKKRRRRHVSLRNRTYFWITICRPFVHSVK
jgi:hypothetical protein